MLSDGFASISVDVLIVRLLCGTVIASEVSIPCAGETARRRNS
jgi:hypothetical protein